MFQISIFPSSQWWTEKTWVSGQNWGIFGIERLTCKLWFFLWRRLQSQKMPGLKMGNCPYLSNCCFNDKIMKITSEWNGILPNRCWFTPGFPKKWVTDQKN
jgi:hypothetical protein